MGATGAVSVPQWKCCRHRELRGHGGTRCPGTFLRTSVLGVGRGIWESQQPANAGLAALGKAPPERKEEEMSLLCKRTRRPWKPHIGGCLKSWDSGGNSLFGPKRTSFSASLKMSLHLSMTFTLGHPVSLGWSFPPLALTHQLGPPGRRLGHDIFCTLRKHHLPLSAPCNEKQSHGRGSFKEVNGRKCLERNPT